MVDYCVEMSRMLCLQSDSHQWSLNQHKETSGRYRDLFSLLQGRLPAQYFGASFNCKNIYRKRWHWTHRSAGVDITAVHSVCVDNDHDLHLSKVDFLISLIVEVVSELHVQNDFLYR